MLSSAKPTKTHEDHPNVTVHGLKSRFGSLSPLATQQTGRPMFKLDRIRQILKKGFDVIHYHNISLVGGPKIYEYGEGIKLNTMHEYWLVCPTHVLFRFNRAPCTRKHCILCGLSYKRPPQWWRYTKLVSNAAEHVDAYIAPSRFIKRVHHEMGFDARILHLPNFLPALEDDSLPCESPDDEPAHPPYFLFVGRLEKIKGLQTLIPIFRNFPKAQLRVAGTGDYGPHLRKLAEGSDNIRFVGRQTQPQLQALYRNARALVIPSLCHEVFPLVILESFRQETPVIVNNLGGMPEIIEESGGGVVYKTEQELVAALERLSTDAAYRDTLGRNGHETWREQWTPETHLERYFALIHEIAAKQNTS